INVGGALGPFICGLVGDTGNPADFRWAFLVAGIGMLISVAVQLIYQHKYIRTPDGKPLGDPVPNAPKAWRNPVLVVLGLLVFSGATIGILYIDSNVFSFLSYLLIACVLFI